MIVPAHDRQRGQGQLAALVTAIAVLKGGGACSLAWFWFMFWLLVLFVVALVLLLVLHLQVVDAGCGCGCGRGRGCERGSDGSSARALQTCSHGFLDLFSSIFLKALVVRASPSSSKRAVPRSLGSLYSDSSSLSSVHPPGRKAGRPLSDPSAKGLSSPPPLLPPLTILPYRR
jgi:hypothetical protein